MGKLDFHLDYYNQINTDDSLRTEAENRILALTEGHDDIIGAMVKLTPQAQGRTTQYANEVTIRIYIRGEDIVATEQAEQPSAALQGALGAVERQVRQRRSKIRDTRRRVTPEFEVVDGADGDEFAADGAFDEIEGDTEARPR